MGNMRKTKSVNMILKAFGYSNTALSLVELVSRFQYYMNKSTIYRILDRLEERGVLYSFSGSKGLKWYVRRQQLESDNDNSNHSYFQCQECGKSEFLPINTPIPSIPNYRVDSANLILVGQCKDCF